MDAFRNGKPSSFGPFEVKKTIDYKNGYEDIPPQNALIFTMTDGSWFAMRPSGTEPKIKFYYYAEADEKEVSRNRVKEMAASVNEMIEKIE